MRDVLTHHYFEVDDKVLWDIIDRDFDEFKKVIIEILNNLLTIDQLIYQADFTTSQNEHNKYFSTQSVIMEDNGMTMNKNKRSNILQMVSSNISKLIWLGVVLIILASIGKYLILKQNQNSQLTHITQKVALPPSIEWSKIDKKIVEGMKIAHNKAKNYAAQALEEYTSKLKKRIDENFLGWYFSYWTQQILGIEGIYHEVYHYFDEDHPGAAEKITEKVQREFSKRVLRPAISQMELERITRETVNLYLINLQKELIKIPKEYSIKKEDWEKHLEGIAQTTVDVEGGRTISLSLKTIAVSSIAGSMAIGKALTLTLKKIGGQVSAKIAGKAVAKMAAKTGGKVAAEAGGKMLGPIIGIGIIIWDVYDHYKTKQINKPILRENLYEYVDLMANELLNSTDAGVMSAIYQLEKAITDSISHA